MCCLQSESAAPGSYDDTLSINEGAGDAQGMAISTLLFLEVVLVRLFPIQVSPVLFSILGPMSAE